MSKFNILVCDGMDKSLFEDLKKVSEFNVLGEAKNSQESISELKKSAHALVIRSATKPNKDFLDTCPELKYIIRAGEGTDNIDKKYCQEIGVKVSNTPGANNNSAAEHAIALMMTLLRKTAWAHSSMSEGTWNKAAFTGNELSNKKIGILGFGRIGQLVAKRLIGFDPKIKFFDPYFKEHNISYPHIERTQDIKEIFKDSDIVTVHVPFTPSTEKLVDAKLLDLMKKDAIFVNAARGGIVDENALSGCLNEGKIRGAALDVFENEPLKEKCFLHETKNLILTPHLGGSTQEAQFRVGEMALNQLKELLLNENLLNEVRV